MMKTNSKKLAIAGMFAALAVAGSLFSFPVFGSKCAPVQHLINVLCAVCLGPWWGIGVAFTASFIRNLLGLGTLLAFPGSMCGALLSGLLYHYFKKLPYAYMGELIGTALIGGMLAYPVASLVMGNASAALFTFVVPFLISTGGGTVLAAVITLPLKKTGMLETLKASLES
ncbi:MAG: energy coupling factor transporter S component ThiW [Lachnospiraceae bacterium]|nr:energy coupling factor transporter S component ThiW [Lachnospiraceae bacterium]